MIFSAFVPLPDAKTAILFFILFPFSLHKSVKNVQNFAFNSSNICEER